MLIRLNTLDKRAELALLMHGGRRLDGGWMIDIDHRDGRPTVGEEVCGCKVMAVSWRDCHGIHRPTYSLCSLPCTSLICEQQPVAQPEPVTCDI